jgi:hypothetical protein
VASEAAGVGTADVAAAALGCAEGCDSDGCCAAALTETSSAAVNIHFQVRMTLLSKVPSELTFSLNRLFP